MAEPDPAVPAWGARGWYAVNEVTAFLVELVALALLAWWGYRVAGGGGVGVLLGVAVTAAAVLLWGSFAAPRARYKMPLLGVLAVKALVLGGSAAALYGLGHPVAATGWAVLVVVDTGVAETFRRRG
ncbi:YrdB family protein [Streptomyces sp. NPDC096205]|uniref:YrdB family protein n=1 Tax=Streptomyces sp. NPDC096205 TaxID=3366081 RepID=UPI0038001739